MSATPIATSRLTLAGKKSSIPTAISTPGKPHSFPLCSKPASARQRAARARAGVEREMGIARQGLGEASAVKKS